MMKDVYQEGKLLFYDYDPRTGVLQVSIRSGDLEKLLARIGPIPEEGIDVTLPRPPLNPSPVAFKGVKQIIPFPGLKEGEYLWSPKFD